MKHLALTLLTALALGACTRADDTPAPARVARTAQTFTITYARTASTIAGDTVLLNPQLQVFVLPAQANADGTFTYPATTGMAAVAPTLTITNFTTAAQTITLPTPPQTVTDGTPNLGIRLVLTTTNRPGRRASSQRLTAAVLGNGVSRAAITHTGTNFSRTAAAINGVFTTATETNVAGFN